MKVTRSSAFYRDLARIALQMDDPAAGLRFLDAVVEAAQKLSTHPFLGRPRPEFGGERRSMLVPNFRNWIIFYRIHDGTVQLQRIIHGARDLPRVLK
jgi:toxin ParE1/3/4